MSRVIQIAAVQLPAAPPAPPGEAPAVQRERNLTVAERRLTQAGRQGADVACLGEMFTTQGVELTAEDFARQIEPSAAAVLDCLGGVARRFAMYVIAPVLCLVEGLPRNAAYLLDRGGRLAGVYFKVHCTEAERALGIVPGESWPVFELDFGRVGVQTCHDNSFPESARCLALNGAEVIFWPHVMSGWGDEFMDVLLRAPAIHNGVFHVPVCYGCPPERAWMPGMMIGRSSIVRPDGTLVADAGRQPGIALAQVDLDLPRMAGNFTREGDFAFRVDMLNDRRPELYAPLTRPALRSEPWPAQDIHTEDSKDG